MNMRTEASNEHWGARADASLRRSFLAAASGLVLAACGASKDDPFFPHSSESSEVVLDSRNRDEIDNGAEPINKDFLIAAIQEAKSSTVDSPRENARRVRGSLRYLFHRDGGGSAFLLNTSGYFLTATYSFLDVSTSSFKVIDSPVFLGNFYDGNAYAVSEFIAHPDYDIAIGYAPTKKPAQPVVGIDDSFLKNGEPSWMYAVNGNNGHFAIRTLSGTVLDPEKTDPKLQYKQGLVKVKGMRPFGGAGGAPIINDKGLVIGVESGVMPYDGPNDRKYYPGATITSIRMLDEVLSRGSIYSLPRMKSP